MKKIIIFFVIVIAIVGAVGYNYAQMKISANKIILENKEYEQLKSKEISGNELATIINKLHDKNENNKIEKDNYGNYIENDTDSVKLNIKFTESDDTYSMETIFKSGVSNFMKFYSSAKFKCTSIEYHQSTKYIKGIYFEQI